ncbi:MAG: putative Permease of the major facilitator superfamily [Herminiimonas sp.]|nr:putative Permease of the major facilitator superfamily [Herminiimonas sp.]
MNFKQGITPFSARPPHLGQAAAPLLFFLLGVIYATWAARIPAIRDVLQLNLAQLGLVLLAGGIGAVASLPLAGLLVSRCGARHAALYTGIGLLLMLPCLALAPGMGWLCAAMAGLGAASSCFDVAINAYGAEAEKIAGRSIMSMLHAWFCVGTMSGALLGSGLAWMAVSPLTHFSAVAVFSATLLWTGFKNLPPLHPRSDADKPRLALLHGPLIILGVIGFCGAMAEGSIADWSGVFMKDQLAVDDGVAPLAFAGFSALMLAARLVCDRLKDRFGARRVVALGALLAAVGVVIAVLGFNVVLTIAGFALTGAGLAAVFPFVFSAAGRHGATALAGVATLSYSGSLIGPPLIGFLAQGWGMQAALAFIALLSVAIACMASRAALLE